MIEVQTLPAALTQGQGPQHSDRRTNDRKRLVYRLVHVDHEGDQGLGRCRNISEKGLQLELAMPVTVGARIVVAFSSAHMFEGVVIWCRGAQCGVALEERIDVDLMLRQSAAQVREQGLPKLKPSQGLWAMLRCDGAKRQARVNEVTQHGLTLTHDGQIRSHLYLSVKIGDGKERRGIVCWSKGNVADIALLEPFSIAELGSLTALVDVGIRGWGRA